MARILVIDDEPKMRQIVRRILIAAEHVVIEAEDGEAGLAQLRKEQPTSVLTDIVMPNIEGIETIREIRRLSPSTKIVAMSGGGAARDMHYLEVASVLGADAVLPKPFRAAELLEAIDCLAAG